MKCGQNRDCAAHRSLSVLSESAQKYADRREEFHVARVATKLA